jgi:outer membrane protein
MTRRLGALVALVVLFGAGPASAQDRMSLKEAVDLLVKNNLQIRAAEESASGAEIKIRESKSLYWPLVNLSGSYARMSLISEMTMQFMGQTYSFRFGLPNNYNFQASAIEQVFNWGRTARTIEASKAGFDLAQDGVAAAKQALSYQVVPLFYGTVFFKEALKVLGENLASFEKKLEIMNQRFQAGLASSFDLDLVRVQVSALKAQEFDFRNNIDKFRLTFNALAGRDPDVPFDPDAALEYTPASFTAEGLLTEALEHRLEFQQILHQTDLGRATRDLAKTADKPTVVAGFNYQFRNGFMPDMEKIRGNWTATLSVAYPVFDGRRTAAQVAQAEVGLRTIELRKADLERMIGLEIATALADLKTIERKLEIEKAKITQAEDALRIAEERYRNGLLSATDLIDAQNALESARLNVLQLIYGHTLGRYNLFRASGRTL